MPAITLLVNPSAGGGRGIATAHRVTSALTDRGQQVDLQIASSGDDLLARARAAARQGVATLYVCGGDGTLRHAATALAGTGTALGLVPCGRGNDLARALKIPTDPAAIAGILAAGHRRAIDLGQVASSWFTTVATFGFDARVSDLVQRRMVPGRGQFAYVLGAIRALAGFQPIRGHIRGEFGQVDGPFALVATANTATYGAGVRIAPHAQIDDGQFDVMVVAGLSRAGLVGLAVQVLAGRHLGHPRVSHHRSAWLEIVPDQASPVFADGEPAAPAPVRIEIRHRALEVIAPEVPDAA